MNRLQVEMALLLVFVLSVSLLLAGFLVNNARRDMGIATRYRYMEQAAGHLIVAAGWQAIERGTGATILGSGQPPADLVVKFIDLGKKGDFQVKEAMKDLIALLSVSPDADLRAKREAWQTAYRRVLESRAKVTSTAISKTDWINAATANIEAEMSLWDAVFAPRDVREQVLYLNSVVRANVAVLCEYAGRERANLGNLIAAGKPVPPDLLETLKSYRSIVDHTARQVVALKGFSSTPPELLAAIDEFEKEFMGSYQGLRRDVYSASRGKQPYPVNGPQWMERATRAINSGLHISNVIGARSAEAASDIKSKARTTAALNIGLFLVTVAVCISVFIFVRRKVIAPIDRVMRESAQLAGAVTHAADAVMITDAEGAIEYVNPAFEGMTGHRMDDVRGKNPRILKSGQQEGPFYEGLWRTVKAGRVWRGHMVNRKRDGSLYEEEMTISPIMNQAGAIVNFVAVKRDITEQKLLRQQLLHAEKLSSLGTFVAGVAHELNNPLTAVIGFANDLRQRADLPEELRNTLGIIADQSKRAVGTVKNLLSYSRPHRPERRTVDVNKLVESTVGIHRYRLQADSIPVETAFAPGPLLVHADEGQIQQVVVNILLNAQAAIKTAGGGGAISVATRRESEGGADFAVITIGNSGSHIPVEDLDRIFTPYFTTKGAGEGTGLGLYISRNIVKEHQGELRAENLPGDKGVAFHIVLPLGEKVCDIAASPSKIKVPNGAKVLVVDDDAPVRKWMIGMLLRHEVFAMGAGDGREAIEYLKNGSFDMVVSDYKMPGMDGITLYGWLAEHRPETAKHFIFLTGAVENRLSVFCEERGLTALIKPVEEEDILAAISQVLAKGG